MGKRAQPRAEDHAAARAAAAQSRRGGPPTGGYARGVEARPSGAVDTSADRDR